MRYFWTLMAYVTSIVVTVASCSGEGNGPSRGSGSSNGDGGSQSTSSGQMAGNGGAASSSSSTGTFTGSSSTGSGAGGGPVCAAYLGDCAKQGFDCGPQGDGCGNILQCGTCAASEACGGGASPRPGVCGVVCTPQTCQGQGFNCGAASDGCNGALDCGNCPSGEICGGGGPNLCGPGICTSPKTCASQGFDCGPQGDGCGNILPCGTCAPNEACGGGASPKPGVCGVICTPKTCQQQGFTCGTATDTCGTSIDCGTCPTGQSCGTAGEYVCGPSSTCTNLCLQQQVCPNGGTTTITGTVYAPNGTDPLYGTLVYVPNSAVQPFTPGVSCGSCSLDVSGAPLVSAVTGVDGTFTITNMPAGANIPLVIQNGRWRRQVVIPTVTACAGTAVAASLTHMPTSKAQGDIPLMAFATGSVDSLECVLRKIGILDTEFTNPGGTGRIQFFVGDGENGLAGGAQFSASTPSETQLWGTQAAIDQYDMVYFPCQGGAFARTSASQQILVDYANAGGRVFATHYSYVWLYDDSPFSTTATWAVDPNDLNTFAKDPGLGIINQGFPQGLALAQWLKILYPTSTLGQIQINTLRHDFTAVAATSSLWISDQDTAPPQGQGTVPMHYTFDTPVGAMPANQCGRVLYDDFHVEDAENNPTTGQIFPAECNNDPMTPQEKMLEFMIFDLGSCVGPLPPTICTPKTCASQGFTCGMQDNGCSAVIDCGACPSGQSCLTGTCMNTCPAQTCASQGFTCGMQGDGCNNTINCGACPSGQACNDGKCTDMGCVPKAACPPGYCGSISDGCNNTIDCTTTCTAPETCGGGGTPNMCGKPICMPKTCKAQGFDCGMATDGCNDVLDCGTCTPPAICGGGATPRANVCGDIGSGS
jgi:hypothetical protein